MGQEPHGIDEIQLETEPSPVSAGSDPAGNVQRLEARAHTIRDNLSDLVDEVERRRDRVLKPLAFAAGGVALVALLMGGAIAWRRLKRRPPPSRLREVAGALRRMATHPERVAEAQPSVSRKVLASGGAALASAVIHQLAQVAGARISRSG